MKKEEILRGDKPSWLKSLPLLERPPVEKSFLTEDAKLDLIKKEVKDEKRSDSELLFPRHPIPLARIDALSQKQRKASSEDIEEARHNMNSNHSSEESFQDEPEDLSSEKDDLDDKANEDLTRELQEKFKNGAAFPPGLFPPFGLGPAGFLRPPS